MKGRRTLGVVALVALASGTAPLPESRQAASASVRLPARVFGQWIWTRRDVAIFERERARHAEMLPAILVATVSDDLRLRYGLDPGLIGGDAAVVVRCEAPFGRLFARGDDALTREFGSALEELLRHVRATGVRVREVQLDYDAPERLLPRWAHVIAGLARGAFAGVPLWITSIPAHLARSDYGELFRGSVSGHVLQVFDTGAPCASGVVAKLRERVARHGLPFRIGIAAFERGDASGVRTEHGCWARAAASFSDVPGFAGAWIFAASAPYDDIESVLERWMEAK